MPWIASSPSSHDGVFDADVRVPVAGPAREMVAEGLIRAGIGTATMALIIFLIEVVEWLATGNWRGWSVEDGLLFIGFEEPLAYFDLLQLATDLLVDLPLTFALYIAGLGAFLIATDVVDPLQP